MVDGDAALEALRGQITAAMLGAPTYDRAAIAASAGISTDFATRLWRAMGFADVEDAAVVFTERDAAALAGAVTLHRSGIVDEEGIVAMTRAMAQSLSRLAVAQNDLVVARLQQVAVGPEQWVSAGAALAEELLGVVSDIHDYIWRRHLAAVAESTLAASVGAVGEDLAVGFADLEGFTALSRRLEPDELAALVDRFESHAVQVIGDNGGRLVKTLGDEVMFAVPSASAGAEIALALAERAGDDDPAVRAGLAFGPVTSRLGDVYGPTVNVASRLTGIARPGTVLLDRGAADALREQPGYEVTRLRRHAVRGYAALAPFRLRRAAG